MANVPDTLLAAVQALEDGDTPDNWLLDEEPKKLSDYFKGKVQQYVYYTIFVKRSLHAIFRFSSNMSLHVVKLEL